MLSSEERQLRVRNAGRRSSMFYQVALYIAGILMASGALPLSVVEFIVDWVWFNLVGFAILNVIVIFIWIKKRALRVYSFRHSLNLLFVVVKSRLIRHILFLGFLVSIYLSGLEFVAMAYLFLFASAEYLFMQRVGHTMNSVSSEDGIPNSQR